jgi:hypothetical protein
MKRAKLMLVAMLMVLPSLAVAQLGSGSTIVAQVPFEFVVANKIVPAGKCVVQRATQDAPLPTLMISNVGASVSLFASASRDETREAAGAYTLVFNKQGDRYFLRGIKLEGSRTTYRLPESKAEAELRARNVPASEEIVLASLK